MKDISAYLSIGSCVNGSWLDENRIVYVETNPEGRSIVMKDLCTGADKTLFSTEERIFSLHVHRESGHIFFSSDIGGTENGQVFVIKNGAGDTNSQSKKQFHFSSSAQKPTLDASAVKIETAPLNANWYEPVNLTNDPATMHQIGGLLPDGKTLILSSNGRDKRTFDIVKVDIDSLEKGMVKENNDNYNMPAALSPNGRYLLYNKLMGVSDNALWMVDIVTGEAVKTPGAAEPASYTRPEWKSDSSGFYLITDFQRDFEYVAYYDISSRSLTRVFEWNWDVVNISLSPCDRYLAVCVNEGGYSVIHVYDFVNKSFCNTPLPPKGVSAMFWKMPWSPGGLKLLFPLSSGKRPMNLWVLEMERDVLKRVTDCHTAGLGQDDFVEPVLREYTSFDGLKVPYWLYVPPGLKAENLPVMVHIHGGPEGQSLPMLAWSEFYQYMVQQGIAVAEPNVRGSTGYGKNYTHLDDVEKRLDSVKDIEYLVKDLVESGIADKTKLGVSGGSYGGFMTLNCAARYPKLWCCAVDIVGMFNLVTFLENTSDYRRPHREAEYGSLAKDRELLFEVSPIAKVDNIKGPLMIIHGQNDPRVPVSEAHQAAEYLTKNGVDVELLVYHDEGHGLVKLKNMLDCYPRVIKFVKKYMGLA